MIPPFELRISCLLTTEINIQKAEGSFKGTCSYGLLYDYGRRYSDWQSKEIWYVVFHVVCGSAIAGGLSMVWGRGLTSTTWWNAFCTAVYNPVKFCLALAIGA